MTDRVPVLKARAPYYLLALGETIARHATEAREADIVDGSAEVGAAAVDARRLHELPSW